MNICLTLWDHGASFNQDVANFIQTALSRVMHRSEEISRDRLQAEVDNGDSVDEVDNASVTASTITTTFVYGSDNDENKCGDVQVEHFIETAHMQLPSRCA